VTRTAMSHARASSSTSFGRAIRDFWRDTAITWRYGGASAIWEALLERTLHWLYRRQRFVIFEEDLATGMERRSPPGTEIRVLGDRDWEPLSRALTTRNFKRFRRRAENLDWICLVAWRGERPVGWVWIAERIDPYRSFPAPLPSDVVYAWGLWVDPRERGRGVGSALVSARMSYARERGFRRVWRLIAAGNLPALRIFEKISGPNARVLGEAAWVTLLGRRRGGFEPASGSARY
jgi:ribosomal protein S18 acetylase RimI-like enzyme